MTHSFGSKKVLDNINLSIAQGEIVCLLGPSGCGKTTLLRLIAGLEKPDLGEIIINNHLASSASRFTPAEKRKVGLLFQDYALFPHKNVIDNIKFGLKKGNRTENNAKALYYLDKVGLENEKHSYPHMLSGGQQQRIALARSLAPQPNLMLLDEPFSGLDTCLRDSVRDQTLHILKNTSTTTLMVTHDPEEAMFMADKIAIMDKGRIVQIGKPIDLYFNPVNQFVASFLGEANVISGKVSNKEIKTLLGAFPANDFDEGDDVDILIRPEALLLEPMQKLPSSSSIYPLKACVVASRMLGRSSLIHLCVKEKGQHLHLHARVHGCFLPKEEQDVSVTVDPQQTFIFKK